MEPCISGAIIVDQLAFIRAEHGVHFVDHAIESLSDMDRRTMRSMTSVSWLPVRIAASLKTHIAEALGLSPLAFQRAVVQGASRGTLNGVFRALLRLVSDSALEKRANSLYRHTYNTGAFRAKFGATEARFVVSEWPEMPAFDRIGLEAGLEVTLAVTGREGAIASSKRVGDEIVFRVRW